MQVWVHLRSGALLRYAGITLLLLIFGAGLYLQFGSDALSYVSGFGKNSQQPLVVSNLPAQQAAIITVGDDWKRTLNALVTPAEPSQTASTTYQNTMVDDLISMYLTEKLRAGKGASVDGTEIAKKYFKNKTYGSSSLRFQDNVFHISQEVTTATYASALQRIVEDFNKKTSAPVSQALLAYQQSADSKDLAPLIATQPIIQQTLDTLIAMEVPESQLQLHKEAAEILLNQVYYITQLVEANGDVIEEALAVSGYIQTLTDGPDIYRRVFALQ